MSDIYILFDSLFYLMISILIALMYIFIVIGTILYIRECLIEKKVVVLEIVLLKRFFSSTSLKFFLLFFIGFNYFMYSSQRSEWINKNTLHHNAKEYFIAYTPIAFYKKMLYSIFSQDSIIIKPFNLLSKVIYDKGEALLPKDDGEQYYWKYRIFNYWYIRGTGYMPDYDPYHPKPITKEQQDILDSMYEVIQGLATSNIADKIINREKYKVFIVTANYYNMYRLIPYNIYIIEDFSDSEKAALQDKIFIEKMKNILSWTLKFQNEYKKNITLKKEIEEERPILGMSYYIVINDISEEMIFKKIIESTLTCNIKYINIYLDSINNIINDNSPLYKLKKSQQELIKDFTFNTYMSYFDIYMLNKQCSRKIEFAFPSSEWIKNELPSIKRRWMNEKNSTGIDAILLIDFNTTEIITTPKGVLR